MRSREAPLADDMKLLVPCPDCGELSLEPIERLAHVDVIPCSLCGGLIDLTAEDCRPVADEAKTHLANVPAPNRPA
jgi:hypothetical protein